MERVRKSLIIMVFLVVGTISVSKATTPGPMDMVHESVDAIIATLKNKSLEEDARRVRITYLIRSRFDFETMSRRILATNWKKASEEQKKRFTELFSMLLENSYIDRIEAYTNEKVKYVKEKVKKNKAIVDTLIVSRSIEIPIRYRLLQKGNGWFVYDVIIEEVSLTRTYRSSYKEIVKKEGFEGLFKRMEGKIKEMEENRGNKEIMKKLRNGTSESGRAESRVRW